MPVSRNRKGQKKKSNKRVADQKSFEKKYKQRMLQEFLETQRKLAETTQKVGEVIENSDIDLGVDIEMSDDEFEIIDDFNINPDDMVVVDYLETDEKVS